MRSSRLVSVMALSCLCFSCGDKTTSRTDAGPGPETWQGDVMAADSGVDTLPEGVVSREAIEPDVVETAEPDTPQGTFSLAGVITLHGYPLAGVALHVSGSDEPAAVSSAADGSYLIEGLAPGNYTLAPSLMGHAFEPSELDVELVDHSVDSLDFSLRDSPFPSSSDAFEDDSTYASASFVEIGGAIRHGTLWPCGDEDWFSFELSTGTQYEFFTTNLCPTCDSVIRLYDSDGQTLLAENDDFIDLESRVVFAPNVDGAYYVRVTSATEEHGVLNYFFAGIELTDGDGDGFGQFHDCQDGDGNVSPDAHEEPGSGVDSNCDGYLTPATGQPDPFEPDSEAAPRPLVPADVTVEETIHADHIMAGAGGTLHDAADVDWFTLTISAHGYWDVTLFKTGGSAVLTLYDPTDMSELDSDNLWLMLDNDDDSAATYLLSVSGDSSLWYVIVAYSVGVDMDGDGYYTMDWDDVWDWDDTDPDVGPCQPGGSVEECQVVLDEDTGLTWKKGEAPFGFGPWQAAVEYCNGLTMCEVANWRLPTGEDFFAMLDGCDEAVFDGEVGHCNSCPDSAKCSALFPDEETSGAWYWTSDEEKNNPNLKMFVGLHDGSVGFVDEELHNRTRCVHD